MSDMAVVTKNVTFTLDIETIAQAFCALNDDQQAKVFVEIARIMRTWPPSTFGDAFGWQAFAIGRHLRTCTCSTEDARELVATIASAARERTA